MKDIIIRDNRTLFKEEENYCKQIRTGNFSNNNFNEYERTGDRSKDLSIKK